MYSNPATIRPFPTCTIGKRAVQAQYAEIRNQQRRDYGLSDISPVDL